MPNIYYLKQNLIWHVIQTEKYKLNTYSFVEMRRINIWMMGVNMSWVTWGLEQSLETAVRTHVASLLLNAKNLWVSGGSNIVVALRINLVIFYLFSRLVYALYFNNLLHVLEDNKNLNRVIYKNFQIYEDICCRPNTSLAPFVYIFLIYM